VSAPSSFAGRTLVAATTFVAACGPAGVGPRPAPFPAPSQHPAAAADATPSASTSASNAPSLAGVLGVARDGESGEPRVEALPIAGFLPAVLFVPAPSKDKRPLLVVTHGAGGRPEPHCDRYRELVRDAAFVLCTRGRETDRLLPEEQRGYFYDGHKELGREARAAIASLVARYGDRVDTSNAMFAGYSQGASMGILFIEEQSVEPALFSRVLLVEGGFADWTIALSERMHKAGVAKVALVCGQSKCQEQGSRSLAWMKKGGLDARMTYARGAGHTYDATVRPLVDEAFEWLVEGDSRFRPEGAGREGSPESAPAAVEHENDGSRRNLPPSK